MTRSRWARTLTASLLVGSGLFVVTGQQPVSAAPRFPDVEVRLTVVEIQDLGDDLDSLSDADFYVMTSIDDHNGTTASFNNEDTPETEEVEGEEHIHPNWEFLFPKVNPSTGSVDVSLTVKEEDGLFNGDDDTADVIAGGVVNAKVDLRPCKVWVSGIPYSCGAPITLSSGDKVVFKIDVLLPAATPGLRMQCLHEPLWPQPGDLVTITATALDGAANAVVGVDEVRITVNGTDMKRVTAAPQATYTFTAVGKEFWYECSAEDQGGVEAASTSPRMVRVGWEDEIAVPVVYTGTSVHRIDIVVLADRDSYPSGASDPVFLKHLHDVLLEMPANPANQRRGYFGNEYVLANQHSLNIWVARASGADADNVPAGDNCTLTAPEDWDRYAFADAGWILHSDDFRDCADGTLKLFSSENDEPGTSVHETGHSPFGLADEYCCDGGYFEAMDGMPNVYDTLVDCQNDAPAVGVSASACRNITGPWFTSDPAADVMAGDRTTFNPLDRRRWSTLINSCFSQGGC